MDKKRILALLAACLMCASSTVAYAGPADEAGTGTGTGAAYSTGAGQGAAAQMLFPPYMQMPIKTNNSNQLYIPLMD